MVNRIGGNFAPSEEARRASEVGRRRRGYAYASIPLGLLAILISCSGPDQGTGTGTAKTPSPETVPAPQSAANVEKVIPQLPEGRAAELRKTFRANVKVRTLTNRGHNAKVPTTIPFVGEPEATHFDEVASRLRPGFAKSTGWIAKAAQLDLPKTADGSFRVTDMTTKMAIDVSLMDAEPTKGELEHGYIVYRGAHRGGDVIHRPTREGTEDYIQLKEKGASPIRYDVQLGDSVAGLRLVANTLEFMDADGNPRLRVAPPRLVDSAGEITSAKLSLVGCAADTNAAPPFDRPVTNPGARECEVSVSWNETNVRYPALLDPGWTASGGLSVVRQGHVSVRLPSGNILVAGGTDQTTNFATTEIYNATTGAFAAGPSMAKGRYAAAAALTGTRWVVTGGQGAAGDSNTAEYYDTGSNTWTNTANNMSAQRIGHQATLRSDNTILVTGGYDETFAASLASADVYDPTPNTFAATGAMPGGGRALHTSVRLADNRILVAGGEIDSLNFRATADLYSTGGVWAATTALDAPRAHSASALLGDGTVIMAGGATANGAATTPLASVRRFSLTGPTWLTTTPDMSAARDSVQGLILLDGNFFVAGGQSALLQPVNTSETLNTTSFTWAGMGTMPNAHMLDYTMNLLTDGRVLVIAGNAGVSTSNATALFDPLGQPGQACTVNADCRSNFCVDSVCCNNACAGGTSDCQACSIAAGAAADGTCGPRTNGTVCRSSGGGCDIAETCDGTATTCPSDTLAASSVVCRAAGGGGCDVAENCTGSSATCPADGFASSGTTCRAAAGSCDAIETCTGSSGNCPADGKVASGTICRPAIAGGCDIAETCDGTTNGCPSDVVASAGTVCRAVAGVCDVQETCTGSSNACPTDAFVASSTVCRAAVAGGCDVAENCSGSAAACPSDTFAASGTVCRASAGACDTAETCTGSSNACPSDSLAASGTVCRAAVAGGCDVAETCTGSATTCPADVIAAAGTVCRSAVAGGCDIQETCSGSSNTCPADVVATAGTVCRSASGVCDLSETCTGSSNACPSDSNKANGTSCSDAGAVCQSGTCTSPEAGTDGGTEAGTDGGTEAGVEAGTEAGVEAGTDGGHDGGHDGGVDSGHDSGLDAAADTGVDAAPDTGIADAMPDVVTDAARDAARDSGDGGLVIPPDDSCSCTTVGGKRTTNYAAVLIGLGLVIGGRLRRRRNR